MGISPILCEEDSFPDHSIWPPTCSCSRRLGRASGRGRGRRTATTSQPCQGVPGAGTHAGSLVPARQGPSAVCGRCRRWQRGIVSSDEGVMVMRKKVLVLGGNFGGLTAALSVKHELEGDVDVTVVSASDRFLFNPSLIWLPFGKRRPADITFPLAPTFESHDVDFVHAAATRIDPVAQQEETTRGSYGYDYLVIATGYRNQVDVIPGLEVANGAYMITTLED